MKKKISLLLLAVLFLFSSQTVLAEDYLIVDRDEQSSGVEITQPGEDGTWDLFYDKETGKFNAVYTITSEAPDEVTLDLSRVNDLFTEYALFNDCELNSETGKTICKARIGNITIKVDKDSMKTVIGNIQGGDSIIFSVTIKNSSGKVYEYKEESLTIATPKQEETDNDVVGFDGQNINEELSNPNVQIGYNYYFKNDRIVNIIMDKAFNEFKPDYKNYYVAKDGTLTKDAVNYSLKVGEPVVLIGKSYFYKIGDYYIYVSSSKINQSNNTLRIASKNNSGSAYDENGKAIKYYAGLSTEKYGKRNDSFADGEGALTNYLNKYYNGDLLSALIYEYNEKYNTTYNDIKEFSKDDFYAFMREIDQSYNIQVETLKFTPSIQYDAFYYNQISVVITSEEDYDKNYKNEIRWSLNYNSEATIGNYMSDKVNGTTNSKYKETEEFLRNAVGELKDNESSSFVYGMNLDMDLTGNYYQGITFNNYTSIKIVAKKGVVIINYVDDHGKTIKESEKVEYYYYSDYETKAATIDGYELIEIDGTEKGSVDKDEIVVTYVYQYVLGQGGEEEKEEPTNLVQTGEEVDYSLMTSAFITASLIVLALRTKKKNN